MQPLWAVVCWLALASQGTGIFWLALASKARAEYAALTTQGAGLLVVLTSRVHEYVWRFVSQCASLAPIFSLGLMRISIPTINRLLCAVTSMSRSAINQATT